MSDKIIDIIAKLYEKAASTDSLAEAEALTAKANELLFKYNIDKAEVRERMAEGKSDKFDGFGYSERVPYRENLAGDRWHRELIKMICRHNLTQVVFSKGDKKNPTFRVYGLMENVEVSVWLYNWLDTHLMVLAKQARKLADDGADYCRHTFLKDFLLGAVLGIECKLNEEAEKSQYKDQINSLIKHNSKAVDEYIIKCIGGITWSGRSVSTHAETAFDKGVKAGRSVKVAERRLSNSESTVTKKLLDNK